MHRLIIVGGGFAGLWATRSLKSADIQITLIDRRNHHLFQPLLYQVASAELASPDIAVPLRHILKKQRNVQIWLGEVIEVFPDRNVVVLDDGRELEYDSLLIATGATHAYFGNPQWEKHAPGIKTLEDAMHLRNKIFEAFEYAETEPDPEKKAAWLNFAIVGGGPTGVELAGALSEIAKHTLRGEFRSIDPGMATVRLIEAGPKILGAFSDELSSKAEMQLRRLGVEVVTNCRVTEINQHGYSLNGAFVPCRTVIWAAGVQASPLGRRLNVPLDRAGRVKVEKNLSVPGHGNIFVAGDLASIEVNGRPVPGVAPAAKQMGAYVAELLKARLAGRQEPVFDYHDKGSLAIIGRMAAVVDVGKFKLSGYIAWHFWLTIHIFILIGFGNRFVVMLNWGINYWTHRRFSRIIHENLKTVKNSPAFDEQ